MLFLIVVFWLGFFFCAGIAVLAYSGRINLAMTIVSLALIASQLYVAIDIGDGVIALGAVFFGLLSVGMLVRRDPKSALFVAAFGLLPIGLLAMTQLLS
ncbi:hypothetical protein KC573_01420 [candidate division WWE3 bacterium]|uniref:Uncharacterized protein n=1 Tax=candidate division WWE3 bacterium TaxID=2053526 RepID=A0A955LVT8_UNCKA|nr:hypothetical protein [candidate division WWE3 bacterium]